VDEILDRLTLDVEGDDDMRTVGVYSLPRKDEEERLAVSNWYLASARSMACLAWEFNKALGRVGRFALGSPSSEAEDAGGAAPYLEDLNTRAWVVKNGVCDEEVGEGRANEGNASVGDDSGERTGGAALEKGAESCRLKEESSFRKSEEPDTIESCWSSASWVDGDVSTLFIQDKTSGFHLTSLNRLLAS
jgi:hypothetical protein